MFLAFSVCRDRLWDQPSLVYFSCPRIKRPGCETDHSPLSHVQFRNVWRNTSHYSVFMVCQGNISSRLYTLTVKCWKGKCERQGCPGRQENFFRPIPWSVCLQYLVCLGCGFESRMGHESLSFVSVVCCQVETSALGWSLVMRSPFECGVSEYDLETSKRRRLWSAGAVKL
jgi:hypothetical protein